MVGYLVKTLAVACLVPKLPSQYLVGQTRPHQQVLEDLVEQVVDYLEAQAQLEQYAYIRVFLTSHFLINFDKLFDKVQADSMSHRVLSKFQNLDK